MKSRFVVSLSLAAVAISMPFESVLAADVSLLDDSANIADEVLEEAGVGGVENASNPLAAVNNTDFRFQYFDLGRSDRSDSWLDGAYMLSSKLKLKYELHYWDTNVIGSSENGFESFHLKPIYFPSQGKLGSWTYKTAIGAEWIVGFGNDDKGIGSGSDQIAPLAAVTFAKGNTVVIPLVQLGKHGWVVRSRI